MFMQVNTESGFLKRTAKNLRQEATPAERYAWSMLRGKNLQGLKFRRQHVIHRYIVDFYCHEFKLCLELDGAPHLDADGIGKDKVRDADLQAMGYKVLHVSNDIVLKDPNKFCQLILAEVLPQPR